MSRSERLHNKEEFRSWVRGLLNEGIVTISFTKKDGTERVMNCVLRGDLIPEDKYPKVKTGETTRAKSTESYAVFDIDKQEWRSFCWADVNQVRYALNQYNTKGEYNGLVD